MLKVILSSFIILTSICLPVLSENEFFSKSLQAIVVKTNNWNSVNSEITLYERNSINETWNITSKTFEGVVGREGMGWGRGIHSYNDIKNDYFRKEGDGKAPAGIFTISEIFGTESLNNISNITTLPYLYLTESIQCVADSKSKYYNMLIDTNNVEKDWDDSLNEKMRHIATKGQKVYKWGFFIDHNSDKNPEMKRKKGAGSCIFMHIWEEKNKGTAGCTALSEKNLFNIIKWLKPEKNPVIIQMPKKEYKKYKEAWKLP